MSSPIDPAHDLFTASHISERARRDYGLPRWYAVLSTALFILGVGVMIVGVLAGWFAPLLAAMILTLNVALFPLLLARWRARGVVPRAGRLARSRYWRIAPVVVPVALILGVAALALWPEQRIWLALAVVVPFGFEHVYRLRTWAQR